MRSPYALLVLALACPTTLLGQQLLAGDLSFVPGETFHFSTIPWTATTTGLVIVHIRDRAGRTQVERVVVGL